MIISLEKMIIISREKAEVALLYAIYDYGTSICPDSLICYCRMQNYETSICHGPAILYYLMQALSHN